MKRAVFMSCVALSLFARLDAQAYDFSPIIAQFEPAGAGSARNFVVRNTQPEPIALQIEVFGRTADAEGNEVRQPDLESFIVAPPQLVLAPGASQTIRARWVGDPDLTSEQAFRIVVRQLPIRFREEAAEGEIGANIGVGYTYEVAAYVAPRNVRPETVLLSAEPAATEAGDRRLRVGLRNIGTGRAILDNPRLRLSAPGGETVELAGDRLETLQLRNLLSGTQAYFDLEWPEELPYTEVQARFETQYLTR